MTVALPVPWLPGADVPNSLADAVQQNLDALRMSVAEITELGGYAKRDLSNNTAGDVTIGGSYQGTFGAGGGGLRARNGANTISFEWGAGGNTLDIWVDGIRVITIPNPGAFPRSI